MFFLCKQIIILLQHSIVKLIILKKEVKMKTKLLLTVLMISAVCTVSSQAAITVDQMTSPEYLNNNGYSYSSVDKVQIEKARAQGLEYYTKDETDYNNMKQPAKFFRKLYVYFDPAAEDYSPYHHNEKTSPSYTDL